MSGLTPPNPLPLEEEQQQGFAPIMDLRQQRIAELAAEQKAAREERVRIAAQMKQERLNFISANSAALATPRSPEQVAELVGARSELDSAYREAQIWRGIEPARRARDQLQAENNERRRNQDRSPDELAGDTALGLYGTGLSIAAGAPDFLNATANRLLSLPEYAVARLGGLNHADAYQASQESLGVLGEYLDPTAMSRRAAPELQRIQENKSDIYQLNAADVERNNQTSVQAARETYTRRVREGMNPTLARGLEEASIAGSVAFNTLENPTVAFDTATSQLPTLIPGIAVGARSAAALRSGMSAAAAREQLRRELAVSTGVMEGSGAYTDAVGRVENATKEELLAEYPQYAEVINQDIDRARRLITSTSAPTAAALQGAFAGAVSLIPAEFATNPLRSPASVRALRGKPDAPVLATVLPGATGNLVNVAKEVTEEGLQSFSGAAAGNIGEILAGNQDVNVLDDTGKAVGEGVAGAFGLSAGLQAPSAAKNTVFGSIRYVGKRVGESVMARGEEIKARVETKAREDLKKQTAVVAGAMAEMAAAQDQIPEALAPSAPVEDGILTPGGSVSQLITGSANRMEAMSRLMGIVQSDKATQEEQIEARQYLVKSARMLREHLAENVLPAYESMEDGPEKQAISNYASLMNALVNSTPVLQTEQSLALGDPDEVQKELDALPDMEIPEGTTVAPEVERAIERVKQIAHTSPLSINREAATKVLRQRRLLSNKDVRQFELSLSLADMNDAYEAASEAIQKEYRSNKSPSVVTQEVKQGGFAGTRMKSIASHVADISRFASAGDYAAAEPALAAFHRFAKNYASRTADMDAQATKQFKEGSPNKKYFLQSRVIGEDGKLSRDKGWVNISSAGSRQMVRQAFADGNAVVTAYNQMLQTYPELLAQNPDLAPVEIQTYPTWEALANPTPRAETAPTPTPAPAPTPAAITTPALAPAQARMDAAPALAPESTTTSALTQPGAASNAPVSVEAPTGERARPELTQEEIMASREYWHGLMVYTSYFNGMKPGDLKIDPVNGNPTMKVLSYITPNGLRVSGTYDLETSGNTQSIENFSITSEDGPQQLGVGQLRSLLNKILEQHKNVTRLTGTRQTGIRGEVTELDFVVKNGKLIPNTETVVSPFTEATPEPAPAPLPTRTEIVELDDSALSSKLEEVESRIDTEGPTPQAETAVRRINDALRERADERRRLSQMSDTQLRDFRSDLESQREEGGVTPQLARSLKNADLELAQRKKDPRPQYRRMSLDELQDAQQMLLADAEENGPSAENTRNQNLLIQEMDQRANQLSETDGLVESGAIPARAPAFDLKEKFGLDKQVVAATPTLATENRFLKHFRPRQNSVALSARVENASKVVADAASRGMEAVQELLVDRAKHIRFSTNELAALRTVMGELVPELQKRLVKNLKDSAIGESPMKRDSFLRSKGFLTDLVNHPEKGVWQYPNRMNLYLAQFGRNKKGNPVVTYSDAVSEAIAVATAQVAMDMVNRPIRADWDDIRERFPDVDLGRDLIHAFNNYHELPRITGQLATNVSKALGVQADPDTPINVAAGVPMSLAQEGIVALVTGGYAEVVSLKVPGQSSEHSTISFLRFKEKGAHNLKTLSQSMGSSTKLEMLLYPDADSVPTFGRGRPATQTRIDNSTAVVSPQQKEAMNRANQKQNFVNAPLRSLIDAMGADTIKAWQGFVEDTSALSYGDRVKAESRNQGIEASLRDLTNTLEMHEQAAKEVGIDPNQLSIHYTNRTASNARIHTVEGGNGQSDKYGRELVSGTKTVMDLAENPAHITEFYRSLAQALGLKIEKEKIEKNVEKLEVMLNDPAITPVIQLLQKQQTEGLDADETADLRDLVLDLQESKIIPTGFRAIHALQTWARFLNALAEGTENQFTTYLATEADGKTNGPAHAIFHMGLHQLNEKVMKQLWQSGMMFNAEGRLTLNDKKVDGDIYQNVGERVDELVNGLGHISKEMRASIKLLQAANLVEFAPDSNGGDPRLKSARGLTKGAVVQTFYASGEKAMLRGIANSLADTVYAKITEALKYGEVLDADFADAVHDVFGIPLKDLLNPTKYPDLEIKDSHMTEATSVLKGNIGGMIVRAVKEEAGGVLDSFQQIVRMTNIQSMAVKAKYEAAYAARRAELVEQGTILPTDALSKKEEDAILASLKDELPTVQLGFTDQNSTDQGVGILKMLPYGRFTFTKRSTDKATGKVIETELPYRVSSTSGGPLSLDIPVRSIVSPGVRAAPLVNQAAGDAAMIISYVNAVAPSEAGTHIFDGIEIRPDFLGDQSELINKIVAENLSQDVFGAVLRTYKRADISALPRTEEARKELSRILRKKGDKFDQVLPWGVINNRLTQVMVNAEQRHKALTAARQKLLNEAPYAMDHMAGAERSHYVERPVIDTVPEVQAAVAEAAPKTEEATASPVKVVTELGKVFRSLAKDGKVHVTGDVLVQALDGMKFSNKVAGSVYRQLKHLIPKELVVQVGSRNAMRAAAIAAGADISMVDSDFNGLTYGNNLFLATSNEGTLVHELIHATTQHLLELSPGARAKLPKSQKEAIESLEVLTREFAEMSFIEDSASDQIKGVINSYLDAGDAASAMGEMLAYGLTDPDLQAELQTRKPSSALKQFAKTILETVRKILGLPKNTSVDNFLGQLVASGHMILRAAPVPTTQGLSAATLRQLPGPTDAREQVRLRELQDSFDGLLRNQPKQGLGTVETFKRAIESTALTAVAVSKAAIYGFEMSPQEEATFSAIHDLIMSGTKLDGDTLQEMSRIHGDFLKRVTPADLVTDVAKTPQLADNRLEFLKGLVGQQKTDDGRTNMLAVFVALSAVSPVLQKALANMDVPSRTTEVKNFDDRVKKFQATVSRKLSGASLATDRSINQQAAMQDLTLRLAKTQEKVMARLERSPSLVDRAETRVKKGMTKLDKKLEDKLSQIDTDNPVGTVAKAAGIAVRGLLTDEGAENIAQLTTFFADSMTRFKPIAELMVDLRGTTKESWSIDKLLTVGKDRVAAARERIREEVSSEVKKAFKEPLTTEQRTALYKAAQADLSSLSTEYDFDELTSLVSDSTARQAEIDRLTSALPARNRAEWVNTTDDLAQFIVTRTNEGKGKQLYANAYSMAHLTGTGAKVLQAEIKAATPLLDKIISLKALGHLDTQQIGELSDLMKSDPDGVKGLMRLQTAFKETELKDGSQVFNTWKGYVPTSRDPRRDLIIAPASESLELAKRGYTSVQEYVPDTADGFGGMMYYAADGHAGAARFNQGAFQTAEATVMGVTEIGGASRMTGLSTQITDPAGVLAITRNKKLSQKGPHKLYPIINDDGKIVAYGRIMDADMVESHFTQQTDVVNSMGLWAGRKHEEAQAQALNNQVAYEVKRRWKEASPEEKAQFVDISEPNSPVAREAWENIPVKTQERLKYLFNDGPVMVPKSAVNNTIGYRNPSVADIFTGVSELPESVRKSVESAAYGILGENAFAKAVKIERGIQALVNVAKDTIIVRSVRVLFANTLSNQLQLLSHGVSPLQLVPLQAKKSREATLYIANQRKIAQIRAEIAMSDNKSVQASKEKEIARLEEFSKSLSIYPLLEIGLLPNIAEGLTEQEEYNVIGDVTGWLKKKTDGLPSGLTAAAKNAILAKDTALYQGLNRFVQVSDFMAKAVVYDKYIADGLDSETALRLVSEEFVNYDLLPGRSQTYLESVGALWFPKYKLRMQKIVLRHMRQNPVRFLMTGVTGNMLDVDTPIDTLGWNAHWGTTIGPGLGLRAATMNPWTQLMN